MKKALVAILIIASVILFAVIQFGSNESEEIINKVVTIILDESESLAEHTVQITFMIYIDPKYFTDIKTLTLKDPKGTIWEFNDVEIGGLYDDDNNAIAIRHLINSNFPHSANLGMYSVDVIRADGSLYTYEFIVHDKNKNSKGRLFSYHVDSSPKIISKPENIEMVKKEKSLYLTFDLNDKHINDGWTKLLSQ